MRGLRRRRLLCDGVTSEAYGKRSRDDEGLDHGSKPSNFVEEPIVAYSRCGTRVLRVGFARASDRLSFFPASIGSSRSLSLRSPI
jgi:hypothetical protein